jgi:hypothetical protein
MGRLFCLFVCYGGQELHHVMDGGGSNCIEEGLQNGRSKVSIRGSMKEKCKFFLGGDLLSVAFKLLSLLLMNSVALLTQLSSCEDQCKNRY